MDLAPGLGWPPGARSGTWEKAEVAIMNLTCFYHL